MASSVSAPRRVPVATNGIVLIHADFLITGIVMTFIGPMLPILAARWSLTDAQSGSRFSCSFSAQCLECWLREYPCSG